MKNFVVFGTGDFSDIVANLIENVLGNKVVGYLVDDAYYTEGAQYNGRPVSPLSSAAELYSPQSHSAAVGFIGGGMFAHRKEVFCQLKALGYEMENLIHPSAVISTEKLGCGNIIFENCVIGFAAEVGDGNILWPLSAINHHNKVGGFNNFSPAASTTGGVTIGSNCFLGNNSTYKNKITVADFTLVGAGAYISSDTEEYGVYVPERSVKLNKRSTDFKV